MPSTRSTVREVTVTSVRVRWSSTQESLGRAPGGAWPR